MSRRSRRSSSSLIRGELSYGSQRSWPSAIERLSVNEELNALRSIPNSYFFSDASDEHDFPHALTFVPAKQYLPKARRVGLAAYGVGNLLYQYHRDVAPLRKLKMLAPKRVLFCIRRKVRREVLFALRRAGFRGSGPGKGGRYRRTQDSQYRC